MKRSRKDEEVFEDSEEDFEETDEESKSEESDSDSEDGEEDSEEVPTKNKREDAVYNVEGLHEKLEEIGWPDNIDWMEKLCLDYKSDQKIDVNDDLAREMTFYTQALDCSREAYEKLQEMKIPFLRPPDYYAEMVKTDTHMLKVKDKLIFQKQKIVEAEERRKSREAKKLAKAVQAEKLKERAQQKKRDIESVKKWRKMREKTGYSAAKDGDQALPFDFAEEGKFGNKKAMKRGVAPGDRSGGMGKRKEGSGKGKNSREFRNSKFGHGGPKRLRKQNTADSTAEAFDKRPNRGGPNKGGSNRGGFNAKRRRK